MREQLGIPRTTDADRRLSETLERCRERVKQLTAAEKPNAALSSTRWLRSTLWMFGRRITEST